MRLEIESALNEYWQGFYRHETDTCTFYRNYIRTRCQALLRNHGLQWNETAEAVLEKVMQTYNPYAGHSFLFCFWEYVRHELGAADRSDRAKEENLQAVCYEGTGYQAFIHSGCSVQERVLTGG